MGYCLLCHGSGEVFALNCFPFPQLFDHGHSGRSRGFRHSGGRAATHQVLDSCAILEQRICRHSHSTTVAASGRRHACGTAVPTSPRTTRPRSTQRRRGEGGHHARASATRCHSRCAALVATWNAIGRHRRLNRKRSEHTCAYPTRCRSRTATLIKHVSMASHSLTTFAGRSIWCRSTSARGSRHIPQVA